MTFSFKASRWKGRSEIFTGYVFNNSLEAEGLYELYYYRNAVVGGHASVEEGIY